MECHSLNFRLWHLRSACVGIFIQPPMSLPATQCDKQPQQHRSKHKYSTIVLISTLMGFNEKSNQYFVARLGYHECFKLKQFLFDSDSLFPPTLPNESFDSSTNADSKQRCKTVQQRKQAQSFSFAAVKFYQLIVFLPYFAFGWIRLLVKKVLSPYRFSSAIFFSTFLFPCPRHGPHDNTFVYSNRVDTTFLVPFRRHRHVRGKRPRYENNRRLQENRFYDVSSDLKITHNCQQDNRTLCLVMSFMGITVLSALVYVQFIEAKKKL
jgi:hypothetical protein